MINIFIAIDNNYLGKWRHVYNSIKANTKEEIQFNIICEKDVKILPEEKNIKVIHVLPVMLQFKTYQYKQTRALYLRWLIPDLCRGDKAIYLDIDLVVTADIKELFDIDLKDNLIAAVPSYYHETIDQAQISQRGTYGGKENNYLSGQLLINCKLWREYKILNELMKFVCLYDTLDETALSAVCKGHVHELDINWCYPASHLSETKTDKKIKYKYDMDKIKIWHWPGTAKPWLEKTLNKEVYERYI